MESRVNIPTPVRVGACTTLSPPSIRSPPPTVATQRMFNIRFHAGPSVGAEPVNNEPGEGRHQTRATSRRFCSARAAKLPSGILQGEHRARRSSAAWFFPPNLPSYYLSAPVGLSLRCCCEGALRSRHKAYTRTPGLHPKKFIFLRARFWIYSRTTLAENPSARLRQNGPRDIFFLSRSVSLPRK